MPQNYQATPIAPSGGRVESLWRGLSDMDVARAAMGQGWPFAAGPRNNDGAREPQRSWGRMSGLDLLVSFGAMPKETRSTERNRTYEQRDNAGKPSSRMERKELAAKAAPTDSLDGRSCLIAVESQDTSLLRLRTACNSGRRASSAAFPRRRFDDTGRETSICGSGPCPRKNHGHGPLPQVPHRWLLLPCYSRSTEYKRPGIQRA